MQRGIVWVVDDDSSIRWVLERALTGAGLTCTTFEGGKEVLDALATKTPDVLMSDIRMPGMDGLALLTQIKQRHPMLPVIIMTAHSDLDAAVSAYQQGAFDYLPKPFDIDEAVALVERAISHYQEQQQPRNVQVNDPTTDIIGEAPAMQDVFRIIGRLSRSSISVLINGESGTGKELVAHALHRHSPRVKAPFIALNMAAIPKDLIESELFGHEKGAFTGANTVRQGRFEQADGGTLFLDELATAPMLVQEKLLRVIEYGELERVGGSQPLQVNVRLVCATNADLPQLVEEGTFRADLLDRLAFDVVLLPSLRERQSDIMLMAEHFAIQMCRELGLPLFPGFTERARETLLHYRWPGNIRELKNVVERSVYRHSSIEEPLDDIIIDPFRRQPAVHAEPAGEKVGPSLPLDLRQFQLEQEKGLLQQSLQQARFNQKQAAELLGLTYHQLRALLKKHQL